MIEEEPPIKPMSVENVELPLEVGYSGEN